MSEQRKYLEPAWVYLSMLLQRRNNNKTSIADIGRRLGIKNEGLQWQRIPHALHVKRDNILYKCVYTYHHTCVHAWIQSLTK